MRRGSVRILALLTLSFIIGFLLSAVVAGASVHCPPKFSEGEKINVAPISPSIFTDLVEKKGVAFTDEKGVLFLLTLADEHALTIEIPMKDAEPRIMKGVFALVQGSDNGGPMSKLQCFFVGVFLAPTK